MSPHLLILFLAQALTFQRMELAPAPPQNPWIKTVADFNGDGVPDVAIGGSKGPLVWYAGPGWMRSTIAEGGYDSVDAEAGDVDGDGDLDLIVGGILWYENPRPNGNPAGGPWSAHRIGVHRTHDVEVGDLDGDGSIEVVVRGQTGFRHNEGHRILVWKQLSSGVWKSHEIRCPEGEGLELADLDSDGDPDIVIGARWYENTGAILENWTEHVYSTGWTQSDAKVATGDIDQDGRLDIVLTPAEPKGASYRVSWFQAPRDRRKGSWKEHVVQTAVESVVHAVGVADLDGDNQPEIVTARMHQGQAPQQVVIYRNRGKGRKWDPQVLSERGSHNIVLADIDGDGAIDILGANHGGAYQPVEWWRNLSGRRP